MASEQEKNDTPEKKIDLTKDSALVDLYKLSTSEHMGKVRRASTSTSSSAWKEGDLCMAPYPEDGRWYHAKIVKLDGKKCRVSYTEYDEEGDVEVEQLLSESEVEHPVEDENENMETVVYEKHSSPSKPRSDRLPIPGTCPPPPALFAKLPKVTNEKESMTNMLMSWYMSGYHTGYYEGLNEGRKAQNGVSNRRGK